MVLRFFSHHGILYYRFIFGALPPRAFCHLIFRSSIPVPFFPSSLVPAPSCKLPWPLVLIPVVISSPRSPWLSAVGYSTWLGGPSVSAACGDLARGLESWGRMAEVLGGQCWRVGNRVGRGWRILSVDHHLGPGGLWWSTGSIWEPLISWKNRICKT